MYENNKEPINFPTERLPGVSLTTFGRLKYYITSHFFGFIKVHFIVDAVEPEHYVHRIQVMLFKRCVFSAIIHAYSKGSYSFDGKEII